MHHGQSGRGKMDMIDDVKKIYLKKSIDLRGCSCKLLSPEIEKSYLKGYEQKELFVSMSQENTVRGLHFQSFPYGQKKVIFVIKGSITGVILDLRENSKTFLKYETVELNEDSDHGIYVPPYCAWGFKAKKESILIYSIDGIYDREYDDGILWKSIDYDWGTNNPLISDRDAALPMLDEYLERKNKNYEMPNLSK